MLITLDAVLKRVYRWVSVDAGRSVYKSNTSEIDVLKVAVGMMRKLCPGFLMDFIKSEV